MKLSMPSNGSQKHSVFLTYDGLTDPLGQSQIIPYLVGIRKSGFRVSIISFEKPRFKSLRENILTILRSNDIDWCPLRYTRRPPVLSTVYDLWKMRRKVSEIHAKNPFQMLHCRSYVPALIGLQWKRKQKDKLQFLFDMRGFWPDERVDGGSWNLANPLYRTIYNYFKRKEEYFLKESDGVVSLTNAAKNILESQYQNSDLPKIHVIPCCSDMSLFDPIKITPERKTSAMLSLGLSGAELVVGYLGSIGSWYLLDEMMAFFRTIKLSYPTAKFLFISHDSPSTIFSAARSTGVCPSDVVIRGANRNDLPAFLSCVDIGVCFIKPTFSKQASSPTKLGEFLSMGIPNVCNAGVGDVDELINRSKAGCLVNDFTEESLHRAVTEIERLRHLDRGFVRRLAETELSLDTAVSRYSAIYNELLTK